MLNTIVAIFTVMCITLASCANEGPDMKNKDHDLPKPAVDLPAAKDDETTRTAVLAGGCFWGVEASFELLNGVTDVSSGYAGGTKQTADYEKVCSGDTQHAEAVKIVYDPKKITFGQLLQVYFTIIDPTTLNAQGPDEGTQYRSAIFVSNDDEKKVAQAYIKQLADAKIFDKPIVTTVEPIGEGFFTAEEYHQNYVEHHPNQPYVRACSIPKLDKIRTKFKDMLKTASAK